MPKTAKPKTAKPKTAKPKTANLKEFEKLEIAIKNAAKNGDSLPQIIPDWMEKMGIIPGDKIIDSQRIGNKSSKNKTDVLIRFENKNSPPIKISAKLSNADYFGNWYGHERCINEFGKKIFDRLTQEATLWANKQVGNPKKPLFVGVSINFGKRGGKTFIEFMDVFNNDLKNIKKIVCGVGHGDNVANCLYISDNKPTSIDEIINNLSPIDDQKIESLSKDIKIIFRSVCPFNEASNRGKAVYTKFQPDQCFLEITDVTTIEDLMKLGKFTEVFPNGLNHNHILDTLQADYKIRIPLRPNPTRQWQFYSESET